MVFCVSPGFATQQGDDSGVKSRYPFAVLESSNIDLGQVVQGGSMQGRIRLKNEGSPDLQIAQVRSSCGLLIQTWPSAPIPAGGEVTIAFRYDTSRIGPFERLITIHSNTYQRNLTVQVKGVVVPQEYETKAAHPEK